jgi:hypothetical protein
MLYLKNQSALTQIQLRKYARIKSAKKFAYLFNSAHYLTYLRSKYVWIMKTTFALIIRFKCTFGAFQRKNKYCALKKMLKNPTKAKYLIQTEYIMILPKGSQRKEEITFFSLCGGLLILTI